MTPYLSEEGLETLVANVARRVADDPAALTLLRCNFIDTDAATIRAAVAACRVESGDTGIVFIVPREVQAIVVRLGGVVGDALWAELGGPVLYWMQC